MPRYRFLTADVFTDRFFGGNPLAVLPDARGLDSGRMQAIAREFNLSETVFVLPPADPAHTRHLRIFTPASELPFAGHPTIGTALLLAMEGGIALTGEATRIVFEEGVDPVPVSIESRGVRPDFATLEVPQAPEIRPVSDPAALAPVLGLGPDEIDTAGGLPAAVSCGVPFTIVRVRDLEALGRTRIDPLAFEATLAGTWAANVLVITGAGAPDADLRARMFAPALGVAEDPATGAAAAALGGWLGAKGNLGDGVHRIVLQQGVEMGRPSRLEIEIERRGGALAAVRIGGGAVAVMQGTIEVPDVG